MAKRLVINLNICDACQEGQQGCGVSCDYFFRPHADDHGVLALRERATFELICRRCEIASCIKACTYDALERKPDGGLKRHNLRCVGCTLCAQACPFGTIHLDMLPFYNTPCDRCIDRNPDGPPCVASCSKGAVEFREVEADEPGVHILEDKLAARAPKWVKREEMP